MIPHFKCLFVKLQSHSKHTRKPFLNEDFEELTNLLTINVALALKVSKYTISNFTSLFKKDYADCFLIF